MYYKEIADLISANEWERAKEKIILQKKANWDDELAILESTVYWQEGDLENVFKSISAGLKYNCNNYELYLTLGQFYESKNINQAYLCYENAEYYCENQEDLTIIRRFKENAEMSPDFSVKKTSIVIVSDNSYWPTKLCVESIRANNMPAAYEMIVVDNASIDETVEWVKTQGDIKLICNNEHKKFSYACNQGVKIAEGENDIFFLHHDTVVAKNTIFLLRMGLYSDDTIGAAGSVSNQPVNEQGIRVQYDSLKEYLDYAEKNNVPTENYFEKKIYLDGFALMLKRETLDTVGLLDNWYIKDDYCFIDYGVRLHYAGWKSILCQNSFIFHLWNEDSSSLIDKFKIQIENGRIFKQKWGFEIEYYANARMEIINLIIHDNKVPISVLEVGCGCGATLARIKYMWPNAEVKGIELMDSIAKLGSNYLDIIQGNIENMELPYERDSYDYIIMGDVLEHLYWPEKTLERLRPYLKINGRILCSIPNILHETVVKSLMEGEFEYQDSGILDRTHIRFFTLSSIKKMIAQCGFEFTSLWGVVLPDYGGQAFRIIEIGNQNITVNEQMKIYQYIISVRKIEQKSRISPEHAAV